MDNKFYDERIYLNSDKNDEAISYIDSETRKYSHIMRNNAMRYGSNIEAYNQYISFISYLIKTMSIHKNAISASIVLRTLTNNGVFSYNNKFNIENSVKDDICGFLGMSIIRGNGSCRHISAFQSDVLDRINLMSDPFYCYITDRDLDDGNEFMANHAINLIEYNGTLYGYDATNNKLFGFVSNTKMKELFSDQPLYVYYKPYIDMMINDLSYYNANNMIKLFDELKNKDIISLEEYKYILYWAKSITSKNESLLRDFHESSKKYIKKITNGLK